MLAMRAVEVDCVPQDWGLKSASALGLNGHYVALGFIGVIVVGRPADGGMTRLFFW